MEDRDPYFTEIPDDLCSRSGIGFIEQHDAFPELGNDLFEGALPGHVDEDDLLTPKDLWQLVPTTHRVHRPVFQQQLPLQLPADASSATEQDHRCALVHRELLAHLLLCKDYDAPNQSRPPGQFLGFQHALSLHGAGENA